MLRSHHYFTQAFHSCFQFTIHTAFIGTDLKMFCQPFFEETFRPFLFTFRTKLKQKTNTCLAKYWELEFGDLQPPASLNVVLFKNSFSHGICLACEEKGVPRCYFKSKTHKCKNGGTPESMNVMYKLNLVFYMFRSPTYFREVGGCRSPNSSSPKFRTGVRCNNST